MKTHGYSGTKTYGVYHTMKSRCNNKNVQAYKWYGAKGIKVCERWGDFKNFLADMGEQPEGLTIDRINNKGDYTLENCRWVTWDVQHANIPPPGSNPFLRKNITKFKTDKLRTRYNRSIINIHTGQVYINQIDLANSLGITRAAVSAHFKGLIKRLKGCNYIFYKDYLVKKWRGCNILFKWRTI